MGRVLHEVEAGLKITGVNEDDGTSDLQGSGEPGGDGSYQDEAIIGSTYRRSDVGQFWTKISTANDSVLDWAMHASGATAPGMTSSADDVTTVTSVDCVLVDEVDAVEWEVELMLVDDRTNRKKIKISAMHDGDASNDAVNVDHDVFSKLKLGPNFNADVGVTLIGAGAAQTMCLRVASSETNGVDVRARRTDLP